jgi:hypothetical protein
VLVVPLAALHTPATRCNRSSSHDVNKLGEDVDEHVREEGEIMVKIY